MTQTPSSFCKQEAPPFTAGEDVTDDLTRFTSVDDSVLCHATWASGADILTDIKNLNATIIGHVRE